MKIKYSMYIILSFITGGVLSIISFNYYQQHKPNEINKISLTEYNANSIDSLQANVLVKGSVESYNKLQGIYRDEQPSAFLFWAMVMANKYGYAPACHDVYDSIKDEYSPDSSIFEMDGKTRKFALSYLKMAALNHDSTATEEIESLKKKIPPEWWK